MPKGILREMTEEYEVWIKENLRYDPDTGQIWWLKHNSRDKRRDFNLPAGSNSNGYLQVNIQIAGKHNTIRLHRAAWFLYYGVWPKEHLDHINNIRDDNRIVNLREANYNQNAWNKKIQDGCASKYKGVNWHRPTKKWRARINLQDKRHSLGCYNTEEEAALAYNKAALEHFGQFAKINIL